MDGKEELMEKLKEFEISQDQLDEVFENKEQIAVSKFYEGLPKPWAIAIQELLSDDLYMNKFDCCFNCYIQYVEGREARWHSGWRPKN